VNERKLIFVVDDDPLINALVVRRFTDAGYHLEAFQYGEDCLNELSRDPDLIILDYFFINKNAEVMNGMEVFDRIKKIRPDMPVIMLSAQEKGEVVLELARKGIDDYIIKDHDLIDNLNLAIKEVFEKRS
jgi:two-component system, OmpR family, response regulator